MSSLRCAFHQNNSIQQMVTQSPAVEGLPQLLFGREIVYEITCIINHFATQE
jgi:hypothetical protein